MGRCSVLESRWASTVGTPTCGMDEEEPPVVPAKAVRRAKTEAIHNLHVMHQSALYGTHRRPSRRVRRAIDAAAADASKSTTIVLEPNRGRSRSMRRHCAADMEMERRQWKSADGRLSHAECNTSRRGGVGEMEERGGEEERVMLMSIKEDASDAEEDPFDRLLYFFDQTIDPYVIPPHWENYVLRGRALLPEEEVHDHLNRQGMENGGRAMEGDEEENEHFLRYIFSPASGGRRMAAGQDDDAELTERLDSTLSGLRTARSVSPPRPPPPPPTPRQEREQANGRSTDKVTVAVMDSVAGTTREVNYKAQNELSRGKGKDADAIVATPRDEAANKVIYEIYQDPYAERNLMEVTAARIPSVQKAIVALFILIEGRDDTPCAADDDGIIVDSIVLVTSPMKVSRTSDVKRDLGGVQSINEKWNNGPLVRIFIAFASAQDALDAGQELQYETDVSIPLLARHFTVNGNSREVHIRQFSPLLSGKTILEFCTHVGIRGRATWKGQDRVLKLSMLTHEEAAAWGAYLHNYVVYGLRMLATMV